MYSKTNGGQEMTIFIPKWLIWTLGIIMGVPIAFIILIALVYGLMFLYVTIKEEFK